MHGQIQISAELVPIPDASGMRRDAPRMRRDFEFRQISGRANSGKIPAKSEAYYFLVISTNISRIVE